MPTELSKSAKGGFIFVGACLLTLVVTLLGPSDLDRARAEERSEQRAANEAYWAPVP